MKEEICKRCGRVIQEYSLHSDIAKNERYGIDCSKVAKVAVKHDYYGCDTGCCGHSIYLYDADGEELGRHFDFDHPHGEDHEAWARKFADGLFPNAEFDLAEMQIVDD